MAAYVLRYHGLPGWNCGPEAHPIAGVSMTFAAFRRPGRTRSSLLVCGLVGWAVIALCDALPTRAQETSAAQEAAATPAGERLGPEELRPLVAPIALYPDDLLAIVLPASTNPVQIVEAQRFLEKQRADKKLQPNPEWDPSILALINYPQVVAKMDADLSWTTALGNAVIDQLDDVLAMIQQLRAEAQSSGYLESNAFWVVLWEDDYWHIDSSDPDWIFVPDYPDDIFLRPEHPIALPPGEPGLKPEHPIVIPPEAGQPRPEHPIALPPEGGARPTQPIAYPPPSYVGQHPYWSPGATFFTGATLGAAFGYGLDWGGDDININIGENCCRGGNINTGDINIGNRVDHRTGDRFNADKQRVNGRDTLKWSGNKARQKAATGKAGAGRAKGGTLPAKKAGSGGTAKQAGGAGAAKKSRAGDLQPNRGNGGSLGNYQSGRDAGKLGNKGKNSLQNSRSRQPAGSLSNQDRSRSRSNAGAFGGYGRGSSSSIYRQSARGGSSFRSSGGGRRGGGGGRRR
jgi:Protein of unknown function (DUF3300)